MNRLAFILIAIIFIKLSSPQITVAQTNQSGQSGQQESPVKPVSPAPPQASATQSPASSTTTVNPVPAPTEAKPKKTWTNEDVGNLRQESAISTFKTPKPTPAKPRQNAAPFQGGKNANWYRSEIQKLQAQIPPLDDKIAKLRDAIDGKQVDEVRQYTWSKPDDWRDQLARLERQRKDIQDKIAGLRDEARHKGIPAEKLP